MPRFDEDSENPIARKILTSLVGERTGNFFQTLTRRAGVSMAVRIAAIDFSFPAYAKRPTRLKDWRMTGLENSKPQAKPAQKSTPVHKTDGVIA